MNIIVAMDEKTRGIGKSGDLLTYLRPDMQFFRRTTKGKTVVMGHSTFLSLPGAQPLKDRRNIVLSRNPDLMIEGAEVVHSIDAAIDLLKDTPADDIFIIGGQTLYEQFLGYCDRAYVTKYTRPDPVVPDKFFPDLDANPDWRCVSVSDDAEFEGIKYRFTTYRRGDL